MSNDLQNKLFHFEADPPKEVWNKIADALDADTEQSFLQRLFNYQEQPPTHIWDNIETNLEENEPAIKVVPITRYKRPLRYVAAAASIIAIVFFISTLSDKQTGAGSVVGGTETVNTTNQSSILPIDRPQVKKVPQDEAAPSSSLAQVEVQDEEPSARKRQMASIRPKNMFRSFAFSERFIPSRADKEEFFDFSELDSYMVYSDDNGNAMKVPKKLFSLVHCDDGDDSCHERIKRLRQKMASAATTSDFGGILEILRQLQ